MAGPLAVGSIVADGYRVDAVLGEGGMGVVYDAQDLRLPRHVAIKAPRLAAYAQALRLEAQALAAVRHPAFPSVHHVARHGGLDLLVMERIYGDTLASCIEDRLSQGQRFTIPEVLDLLIAIADGLSAAHRVGVVHRDLKPLNVMMSGERVVLLDLGLFVPEVLVGPDNIPAGSAHAVAPEILLRCVERGQSALVDLYALGALAYELLVGSPPYVGDSLEHVLAGHVSSPVPDPAELRDGIPRDLAAIVRELLAKDPAERPSSAEAVLWQLKDIRARGVTPSARTSVLVVDDDPAIGVAVQKSFELAFPQLTVSATTDPQRALPYDGRAPADVLVVDVAMPRVNGLEICMAMRSLPPERRPAIIVMSGSAERQDVDLLRALGVSAYVPKDDQLLAALGVELGKIRCGS